ncbi:MAG TPA: arginine decarboxylase, partial [Syntrophomonas wolfei]|nr:arginine decarboxylase [Syntrophomonas wolfei]
EELARDYRARAPVTLAEGEVPPLPCLILAPREAYLAAKKSLPLEECRGAIAGEIIAAYPPGVPCLLPGELIDDTMLDYLRYLKKSGLGLQGPQDPALNYVKIIE